MADEPDVQVADITPEDFMADEQESPKTDSSPVEAKAEAPAEEKPEVAEPEAPAEEEAKAETEGQSEDKTEETETETPKDETLAPKSQARFQNLANENRDLRRQVEQLTAQTYQPATEEDLANEVNPETGENYNRLEAKFEAYRQSQEIDKYNSQVVEAQASIGNESLGVLNDFPRFNPNSDQFEADLALDAAQLLEANLIRDPNVPELDQEGKPTGKGIVIGSNISPYQLYKTLDKASSLSITKGQIKGQQATETMLANADTGGSNAAPAKQTVDPVVALWKED